MIKSNSLLFILFSLTSMSNAQIVKIGTQVWTKTNLNVSTYRNGDSIPEVQDTRAWDALTTGAWCYYENKSTNGAKYGKLYNWYAVNDSRGLAPKGYHIPDEAEWLKLINYLGGPIEYSTPHKMKTTKGWIGTNGYLGLVGNGNNSTGFSALPGGLRNCRGYRTNGQPVFQEVGHRGVWWSTTSFFPNGPSEGFGRYMEIPALGSTNMINHSSTDYRQGLSVRCIKD